MIEGSASEVSEEDLRDAMVFADGIVRKQCDAVEAFAARINREKQAYTPYLPEPEFLAAAEAVLGGRLSAAVTGASKLERQATQDALKQELKDALTEKFTKEDGTEPDFGLV